MVDWLSLTVPLAYLGVLIGSLATFSSLYRKRKARKASTLEPWFPAHLQRDIYFSLLHLDPAASSTKEKKAPAVPDSVLKAALLRRAVEDIRRVIAIRNEKQALAMLLQRGSVGDDLWQRFLRAEKEMEDEVRDVVAEANAYVPNWGQTIFQTANEMMNNALLREKIGEHQSKLDEERTWWDRKKSNIQEGFMKELDGKDFPASSAAAKIEQPAANTPAVKTASSASEDDAVLVEADESATAASGSGRTATGGGGGGGGGKKKKKGKK